jgi:hypothetical protein
MDLVKGQLHLQVSPPSRVGYVEVPQTVLKHDATDPIRLLVSEGSNPRMRGCSYI